MMMGHRCYVGAIFVVVLLASFTMPSASASTSCKTVTVRCQLPGSLQLVGTIQVNGCLSSSAIQHECNTRLKGCLRPGSLYCTKYSARAAKGETCCSVAKLYGLTCSTIAAFNGRCQRSQDLPLGSRLCVEMKRKPSRPSCVAAIV